MSDVDQTISFPSDLWQRVVDRAAMQKGLPILLNGEPATMGYLGHGYLVAILVKRGLDQLDAQGKVGDVCCVGDCAKPSFFGVKLTNDPNTEWGTCVEHLTDLIGGESGVHSVWQLDTESRV